MTGTTEPASGEGSVTLAGAARRPSKGEAGVGAVTGARMTGASVVAEISTGIEGGEVCVLPDWGMSTASC